MIILIAGASHTGKTALAQKLLEKYKYPYLSIDHLKMGLIRSGNTELTPTSADPDLTGYLWAIVREIIKTAKENKQNLIVEGCYIPFDWKNDFKQEYHAIRLRLGQRCLQSKTYISKSQIMLITDMVKFWLLLECEVKFNITIQRKKK